MVTLQHATLVCRKFMGRMAFPVRANYRAGGATGKVAGADMAIMRITVEGSFSSSIVIDRTQSRASAAWSAARQHNYCMASSTELDLELGASRRWSEAAPPDSARPAPSETPPAGKDAGTAEGEPEEVLPEGAWARWIRDSQSWLSSLIVHMVLLILLALWVIPGKGPTRQPDLKLTHEFSHEAEMSPDILPDLDDAPPVEVESVSEVPSLSSETELQELTLTPADDLTIAASPDLSDHGVQLAERFLDEAAGLAGDALSGRGKLARATLVRSKGGNQASEDAVEMALAWLAAHQLPNGAWSFDHRHGACQGRCTHEGSLGKSFNGATAIALLPFLGAGQTHLEGQYKDNVKRGLYHLVGSIKVTKQGGSLWEEGGSMYSHGLGAIALCESYAMTRDADLARAAQLSLNFIQYAQDPLRGGWRYQPQSDSDTSVVGWQVMALKSGHMAYLRVNPATVKKAYLFLDSVQAHGGATYGYTAPDDRPATSAVGLLCRMYLGWRKETPALGEGIELLVRKGPDKSDMYYNYYATQAVFQYTGGVGSLWDEWNEKMRDFLIATQAREGHEKGSWYLPGNGHNATGGRLYVTAMATMILEIYYRHMPIYQEKAIEEEFPE